MLVLLIVLAAVLVLVAALAAGFGGGFGSGPTVVRRTIIRRPTRRVVEEPVVRRRVYEDDAL